MKRVLVHAQNFFGKKKTKHFTTKIIGTKKIVSWYPKVLPLFKPEGKFEMKVKKLISRSVYNNRLPRTGGYNSNKLLSKVKFG